jgi:hypothetical protein
MSTSEDKLAPLRASNYPECQKFQAVREQANQIGNFIDFLRDQKKITFAKWYTFNSENPFKPEETEDKLMPEFPDMEKLLAEYFNIDLNKLEKEKVAMLEDIRRKNNQ